jgi:hypothetical protein
MFFSRLQWLRNFDQDVIGKSIFYSMIQRYCELVNGSQRWSQKNGKKLIITRDNEIVESMFERLLDTIISEDSENPEINPEIPENPEHSWCPWSNEALVNFENKHLLKSINWPWMKETLQVWNLWILFCSETNP